MGSKSPMFKVQRPVSWLVPDPHRSDACGLPLKRCVTARDPCWLYNK